MIRSGRSDHDIIYAYRRTSIVTKTGHRHIRYRSHKHFIEQSFRSDLMNAPWCTLDEHINEPEVMWDKWKSNFLNVLHTHEPIRFNRTKLQQSPWINRNMLSKMHQHDYLKKTTIRTKDSEDWAAFKKMKNEEL